MQAAGKTYHHPKRGTVIPVRHNGRHMVSTEKPLERFAKYLRFDATTGCVLWTGGTCSGRGHTSPYGAFWFEGKRWSAHRWAAKFIHGLEIDGLHVDHNCPHTGGLPNTLCVEHLQAITNAENVKLQHSRYWVHVQVGLELEPPVYTPEEDAIPFYEPPAWLVELQPALKVVASDCPF